MRVLAIDYGQKRVGIALSDPLRITAQGLKTIVRISDSTLISEILSIIKDESVSEIVLGLPLNMDGSKGKKVFEIEKFAEKLKEHTDIVIKFCDERLTTMQAERLMIDANTSRKKRKHNIDKIAAQLILQGYLDSQSNL